MSLVSAPPPDSEHPHFIMRLPRLWKYYALLARFDRPIGGWLLFWPCAWGLALAGAVPSHLALLLWFLFGAFAMRGAGCVYNDIIDRKLDAQISRTSVRPLASGAVSVWAAMLWAGVLCLGGLITLLQLPPPAAWMAVAALFLVAFYPFMKRITWWPQAWLGLAFSWGALVSWVAVIGEISPPVLWLYLGSCAWVIGYDTIYAVQDIEDDALAGVKSTARAWGTHVRAGVGICYGVAFICWTTALLMVHAEGWITVTLLPTAAHLAWQWVRFDPNNGAMALAQFRSNRYTGLLVFGACLATGS